MSYTKIMYLGIDIGGTKTLAATLTNEGVITESVKFPTPKDYAEFKKQLKDTLKGFKHQEFKACGVGLPVTEFDRKRGVAIVFGNLPWQMVPIQKDIEKIVDCPVAINNDAKLAALSEAMLLKQYSKVLYVTISTGIGTALVVDRVIDDNVGDAGGATMLLDFKGKPTPWEKFASGRAIVERYGRFAEDIPKGDPVWPIMVQDWTRGFLQLTAMLQPDVIVIGGSVGAYFDKYGKLLAAALKKHETPLMTIPPIIQAQRPNECVVYGAYDYAVQKFKDV